MEAQQLQDPSFQSGLFGASSGLGDPNNQSSWKVGGSEDTDAHILLMIASDEPSHLSAACDRIISEIQQVSGVGAPALHCIWWQPGATLPGDLRGHEHFGFKDGISQPAPRGRVSSAPFDYLTPRWLDTSDPDSLQYAEPGRPLIWPGQFVFGLQRQNFDAAALSDDAAAVAAEIAKGGDDPIVTMAKDLSRQRSGHWRLQQRVDEFHAFLRDAASGLARDSALRDITPEKLGALLVGRWPSGAPVMRAPDRDDSALAHDDFANNKFQFAVDSEPNKLIPMSGYPGDNFPQAKADFDGLCCPLAAHIRKVNPRDQDTDQRSPLDTLAKLIIRRGIPYGSPSEVDRGLCFVSYQSSITGQFEFLTKTWANDTDRARNATVGQETT